MKMKQIMNVGLLSPAGGWTKNWIGIKIQVDYLFLSHPTNHPHSTSNSYPPIPLTPRAYQSLKKRDLGRTLYKDTEAVRILAIARIWDCGGGFPSSPVLMALKTSGHTACFTPPMPKMPHQPSQILWTTLHPSSAPCTPLPKQRRDWQPQKTKVL